MFMPLHCALPQWTWVGSTYLRQQKKAEVMYFLGTKRLCIFHLGLLDIVLKRSLSTLTKDTESQREEPRETGQCGHYTHPRSVQLQTNRKQKRKHPAMRNHWRPRMWLSWQSAQLACTKPHVWSLALFKLCMMLYTCNSMSWEEEVETGGSEIQGHTWLHSKLLHETVTKKWKEQGFQWRFTISIQRVDTVIHREYETCPHPMWILNSRDDQARVGYMHTKHADPESFIHF